MKTPDLILFAKQPVAGQVKTRLQPELSAAQAAELAGFLIRATAEAAASNWPGDVYLCCAPDAEHPLFRKLAREFHLRLAVQVEGDLGARMHAALADGIRRRGAAAVMGCDVPHCRWEVFERAYELLAKGRNVIGPAEDGGYYLLGLQSVAARLFQDIHWGSAMVTLETMARAATLGLALEPLPVLRDIDTYKDLLAVSRYFAPLRQFLPPTQPTTAPTDFG